MAELFKKNELIRTRKFGNLFRFIDDFNVSNDGKEFENNFKYTFFEELQLNKENSEKLEASFLDLQIKIDNGKFIAGLIDTRDNFPSASLEYHTYSFYSAIGAETIRIAKANNKADLFDLSVKPLIFKVIKQDAHNDKLSNILINFFQQASG